VKNIFTKTDANNNELDMQKQQIFESVELSEKKKNFVHCNDEKKFFEIFDCTMKSPIDLATWPRREHFALFNQYDLPFFGVTAHEGNERRNKLIEPLHYTFVNTRRYQTN
jgi:hypothetical protein